MVGTLLSTTSIAPTATPLSIRLPQPSSSAPASGALFMVYERYSGGWRSRFVGARSKFHAVFDGAVRGCAGPRRTCLL